MPSWFSFPDFALAFSSILLQALPFLLLGAVFSAALDQFVPARWLAILLRGSVWQKTSLALLGGFFFPVCECGALPIVRRFILRGVSVPVAATYLFASSILNPLCVLSTWMAFRNRDPWMMCGGRLLGGMILVLLLSFVLSRWPKGKLLCRGFGTEADCATSDCDQTHGEPSNGTWRQKLGRFIDTLSHDFIGVAFFVVIGATCAAFFNTVIPRSVMEPWLGSATLAPILTIGLAHLLCLCSTTDAFIIAAMPQVGSAASLAFLLAGPLFDWKLLWIYRYLFRWPVVIAIGLVSSLGAYLFAVGFMR